MSLSDNLSMSDRILLGLERFIQEEINAVCSEEMSVSRRMKLEVLRKIQTKSKKLFHAEVRRLFRDDSYHNQKTEALLREARVLVASTDEGES